MTLDYLLALVGRRVFYVGLLCLTAAACGLARLARQLNAYGIEQNWNVDPPRPRTVSGTAAADKAD